MYPVYGCLCFAVPSKLLRKLAARGHETDRLSLSEHIQSTDHLRAQRSVLAVQTAKTTVANNVDRSHPSPLIPAYYRTIFDAGSTTTLPGKLLRTEGGKPTGDVAANQVYDNTGIALEFYLKIFGRRSIDNQGMKVESAIHFGSRFSNAMWAGDRMIYGDGDQQVSGFTGSLDIIAHELTHGVLQYLIPGGLGVYRLPVKKREFKGQTHALKGQSGALNESFSDVFGSMVKQWHAGERVTQASWVLGEHVLAPQYGKAIRSLKDPGNRQLTWYEDDQFKTMDQLTDGADVHDSSGIPNHAFYLVAKQLGGFSWDRAGLIWYEAFAKLKPKASFLDAANATRRVAALRFGNTSKEFAAVAAAWKAVKVTT